MAKLYGVCGRQLFLDATASRRARVNRGTGSARREQQRPGNARRSIKRKTQIEAPREPDGQAARHSRVDTKSAERRILGVLGRAAQDSGVRPSKRVIS